MEWASMTLQGPLNRPLPMLRADKSTRPTRSYYITASQSPVAGTILIDVAQEELYALDSLTNRSLRLATLPCMKYKMV